MINPTNSDSIPQLIRIRIRNNHIVVFCFQVIHSDISSLGHLWCSGKLCLSRFWKSEGFWRLSCPACLSGVFINPFTSVVLPICRGPMIPINGKYWPNSASSWIYFRSIILENWKFVFQISRVKSGRILKSRKFFNLHFMRFQAPPPPGFVQRTKQI